MTFYESPVDFHNVKGKTIFLTGCSIGIGRAVARSLEVKVIDELGQELM